jgi:ketosteroid isomerase-like protein
VPLKFRTQSSHGPTQDGLLAILLESIHSRIRRNNGEDMTTGIANSKTTDEAQIRALIDDRAKAVRD